MQTQVRLDEMKHHLIVTLNRKDWITSFGFPDMVFGSFYCDVSFSRFVTSFLVPDGSPDFLELVLSGFAIICHHDSRNRKLKVTGYKYKNDHLRQTVKNHIILLIMCHESPLQQSPKSL